MQKIILENPQGETTEFINRPPYIFWTLEGVHLPSSEIVRSTAPGQDGYSFQGVRLLERPLTLACHVHGTGGMADFYTLRRELMRRLCPAIGLSKLTYGNDAGTWYIYAIVKSITPQERVRNIQTLSVELECPDPYWHSLKESSFRMLYVDGGFSFPYSFPVQFGLRGYRQTIHNDCNCMLPMEIRISGGAVNPYIKNTSTGEYIKIRKEIPTGKTLYINTDFESPEVSILDSLNVVETNAFGYMTADSSLFRLSPGENALEFDSEDNTTTATIIISYYERAAGL